MAEGRLTVGNVEIVGLTDIVVDFPLSLSQMFPDVPPQAWAPYVERFPDSFPTQNTWRGHFGGFLIRSDGRTILVDTGMGSNNTNPGPVAMFTGGVDGRLLEAIREEGVGLEDIDTVFFTHLHPDHVGWNLSSPNGGPKTATFPNARYTVPQADWDTFKDPEMQSHFPFSFWDETLGPLESQGVVDQISGEYALTSEISAIPTPGHTPGSTSLVITSGGEHALLVGDVTVNPAQISEPDWVLSFDMDPTVAIESRKRMIDRSEADDAVLIACHFHTYGRVIRTEGRRYWRGL